MSALCTLSNAADLLRDYEHDDGGFPELRQRLQLVRRQAEEQARLLRVFEPFFPAFSVCMPGEFVKNISQSLRSGVSARCSSPIRSSLRSCSTSSPRWRRLSHAGTCLGICFSTSMSLTIRSGLRKWLLFKHNIRLLKRGEEKL